MTATTTRLASSRLRRLIGSLALAEQPVDEEPEPADERERDGEPCGQDPEGLGRLVRLRLERLRLLGRDDDRVDRGLRLEARERVLVDLRRLLVGSGHRRRLARLGLRPLLDELEEDD